MYGLILLIVVGMACLFVLLYYDWSGRSISFETKMLYVLLFFGASFGIGFLFFTFCAGLLWLAFLIDPKIQHYYEAMPYFISAAFLIWSLMMSATLVRSAVEYVEKKRERERNYRNAARSQDY